MLHRVIVIVLSTGLGISIAQAANQLPFLDGTYASEKEYCALTREAAINKGEFVFLDIRGNELHGYESRCEIRDVTEKAKTIRFKAICESEGETEVKRVTWKRLSKNTFTTEYGVTFTACGRFVE